MNASNLNQPAPAGFGRPASDCSPAFLQEIQRHRINTILPYRSILRLRRQKVKNPPSDEVTMYAKGEYQAIRSLWRSLRYMMRESAENAKDQ